MAVRAPGPATSGPFLSITFDQRALDRAVKRLDKLKGEPLAKRTRTAQSAGLSLLVPDIKAGASRHRITGKTERSVGVKALRRKPGEISAYKVGIKTRKNAGGSAWYGHFPISGTPRQNADPYVDEVVARKGDEVKRFVEEQITRLV